MGRQSVWVNPNPSGGTFGKLVNRVFVSQDVAPTQSPAPAGHPIVPQGWVRQIAGDGSIDTIVKDERPSGMLSDLHYLTVIQQFVVPYFSGGWPADPLIGTPGHTPPGG